MPELENEVLEGLAQRIAAVPEGGDVSEEDGALYAQLSADENAAVTARVSEIGTEAAKADAEHEAEGIAEDATTDAEGYVLVLSTNLNHDDGDSKAVFDDLLPTTEIAHLDGVSVSLDKPVVSSKHGIMRARIIQDVGGRAFVFRKDFPDEQNEHGVGVTRFKVTFSVGAL